MTAGELAQILVSAGALISSVTALIVAVRGHAIASTAASQINGQAEQINTLREAKGFAEGKAASGPPSLESAEHPAGKQT